ncbi:MAG TPA: right-handed parallel beta-helix repeat-containing protein [Panacibacter sp.]|nr:right-handed parallel beta-helix repeat-containing protein [Panacibacter sp.]
MKYILFILSAMLFYCCAFASPEIRLRKGLSITHSATVMKDTYLLNADTSLRQPLIIIEGSDITIDFNQCIVQGSNDKTKPNQFYGLAILIKKGSRNVTLKNANIHGFKVALMADNTEDLVIENCNFSYNYRQQLHSNLQREDVSDWMSYHHNENDEWLRYGAGIYLKDCNKAILKNNTITGTQCALMMMRCNYAEVYGNNFSFNSGIGIGLYRSSNNYIYGNKLDFNVRGYSYGIYNRGQDSAGILVFEQCSNNVFAYNSVTHSGDGFFLWAGQYTMDTGEGGCNDNLLYGNDFSYAPTNGVEVTFSRNRIEMNNITGCDNGIWGGYSYETRIFNNKIDSNKTGIAIEHGHINQMANNSFKNNKTAIKLWSREQQPADWKYAQVRDTRSLLNDITGNKFYYNKLVYDIMGSDSTFLGNNSKSNNLINYKIGERVTNLDSSGEEESADVDFVYPEGLDKLNINAIPKTTFPRGRNQMRITEWGPYNFEYPILWLNKIDSNGLYHFEVLAKTGNWKLKSLHGFTLVSKGNSNFPSVLIAKPKANIQERTIQLEYNGPVFIDTLGKNHAADKPFIFEYTAFDAQAKWNIRFYKWNESNDPNKDYTSFLHSLSAPVYTATVKDIDYTWWGTIGKDLPADSFATVAATTMNLPDAVYEISITADDLVKLLIDGKEVIDAWDAKYTTLDEDTNHRITLHLKGKHDFKIIHAENTGLATLMFYIKPVNGKW